MPSPSLPIAVEDHLAQAVRWTAAKYPPPPDTSQVFWYYVHSNGFFRQGASHQFLYEELDDLLADGVSQVEQESCLARFCLETSASSFLLYCHSVSRSYTRSQMRLEQISRCMSALPEEAVPETLKEVRVALHLLLEDQQVSQLEGQMRAVSIGHTTIEEATLGRFQQYAAVLLLLTDCVEQKKYAEVGALTSLIHYRFSGGSVTGFTQDLLRWRHAV